LPDRERSTETVEAKSGNKVDNQGSAKVIREARRKMSHPHQKAAHRSRKQLVSTTLVIQIERVATEDAQVCLLKDRHLSQQADQRLTRRRRKMCHKKLATSDERIRADMLKQELKRLAEKAHRCKET
jgi:hypothetical protein